MATKKEPKNGRTATKKEGKPTTKSKKSTWTILKGRTEIKV